GEEITLVAASNICNWIIFRVIGRLMLLQDVQRSLSVAVGDFPRSAPHEFEVVCGTRSSDQVVGIFSELGLFSRSIRGRKRIPMRPRVVERDPSVVAPRMFRSIVERVEEAGRVEDETGGGFELCAMLAIFHRFQILAAHETGAPSGTARAGERVEVI